MSEVRTSEVRLSNGKTMRFVPLDATKLLLNTSSVAFIDSEKDIDGNITAISLEGKYEIHLGDQYEIRVGVINSIYVVNSILVHKDENSVVLLSETPTKTSVFLLPLLGKTKTQLRYTSYYSNTYLSKDYKALLLVYRFTGTSMYKQFEQYMMTDSLCVTHTDHDPYHVVYMFAIPREFREDVKHFVEGKYSKFSKKLRQRITKFYGNKDASVIKVIDKDQDFKLQLEKSLGVELPEDSELASKPDLSNEIYEIKYVEKG